MSQAEFLGMMIICGGIFIGAFSPLVKNLKDNTRAMTENTLQIKQLTKNQEEYEKHNHDSHQRLWDKNDEQDHVLDDHEMRIHDLEGK